MGCASGYCPHWSPVDVPRSPVADGHHQVGTYARFRIEWGDSRNREAPIHLWKRVCCVSLSTRSSRPSSMVDVEHSLGSHGQLGAVSEPKLGWPWLAHTH
jgi:hypothetical protein